MFVWGSPALDFYKVLTITYMARCGSGFRFPQPMS
jgi:hypothetical protein